MNKNKKGRPKLSVPTKAFTIRFTDEEHQQLSELAKEHYMTNSAFIKFLIQNYLKERDEF